MLTTEQDYQDFEEQVNSVGLVRNESGDWEAMTYGEFLREYCSDETTTPKGNAPRMFIHDASDDDVDPPEFEIREWKPDGSTRTVTDWELENKGYKEAELYLLHLWENNIDGANAMFFSPEEAAEEMGRDCALLMDDEVEDDSKPPQVPTESDVNLFADVFSHYHNAKGGTVESEKNWRDEVKDLYWEHLVKFEEAYKEEIKK